MRWTLLILCLVVASGCRTDWGYRFVPLPAPPPGLLDPVRQVPSPEPEAPHESQEVVPTGGWSEWSPSFQQPMRPLPPYEEVQPPTPLVLQPARLTLQQAVAETLANDPAIQAATEDIHLAGGEFVGAARRPNPTLNVIQTLLPLTRPFTPEREGGPPQLDIFLSYPVDWWLFGKRVAEMETAQAGLNVAVAEVADIVRERTTETAVAYFDVLENQALLDLAELDLENLMRIEEMTERLVASEDVPAIELDQIRVEVLTSRQELRAAQVELVEAQSRLQSLMGRVLVDPHIELEGTLEVDRPVLPFELPEAIQLAETYRPDLAALQRSIHEAAADLRLQGREAWPEMNLEVGYSRQFQRRVLEMPDANSWGIGLDVELPFSDRNQGQRVAAAASLRQSQHQYRAALLKIRAEVATALEMYRQAYLVVTTEAPAQVEAAIRARENFEQACELAGGPYLETLDAQQAFRETRRLYIEALGTYWRSLYELNAAVGAAIIE